MDKTSKQAVIDNATAGLIVMELYSKLDNKKERKRLVEIMLESLLKENKISNAVYKEALNILED